MRKLDSTFKSTENCIERRDLDLKHSNKLTFAVQILRQLQMAPQGASGWLTVRATYGSKALKVSFPTDPRVAQSELRFDGKSRFSESMSGRCARICFSLSFRFRFREIMSSLNLSRVYIYEGQNNIFHPWVARITMRIMGSIGIPIGLPNSSKLIRKAKLNFSATLTLYKTLLSY